MKHSPDGSYLTTPKKIFLKPLTVEFRAELRFQPAAARAFS